jgi:Patatin-like phospholipase
LGLGVKQWTVDQSITRFIQLCDKAFTPRELDSFKILRPISLYAFRSRYKSKPLRNALLQSFGDDLLYGHVPEDTLVRDNKVCVTTTSGTADSAIAIGNYTRQSEDDHWYKFQPGDYMQVWEAASATSAAPKYFKKFVLPGEKGPNAEFLDGALYFNNPVRIAFNERRFLWPDVADTPPDIVLSLGTGQNARVVNSIVRNERSFRTFEKSRTVCLPEGKIAKLKSKVGNNNDRKRGVVKNVFETLVSSFCKSLLLVLMERQSNMLDSILDAEREFKLFEADHSHAGTSDRYIRLNPDLQTEPPALDDTSQMLPLQEKVQKIFKTPSYELITERIAYRLVASSFYFVKDVSLEHDEWTRSFTCKGGFELAASGHRLTMIGRIACRFEGNANDMKDLMRHLGEFFRRQSTPNFRPYFTVKENSTDFDSQKVILTSQLEVWGPLMLIIDRDRSPNY